MTDDSAASTKKRELPIAVQQARAARQVVAQFLPKVGPWQEQVAKLLAIAARHPDDAERQRLATDHQRLLAEVEAALSVLEAQIADAPDSIRGHSRVADARRAAEIVRGRLDELGAMLG